MIRRTEEKDVPAVMEVIEDARANLKARGIPQWQNGYPNADSIRQDIKDGASWLMEENGKIVGTCCIRLERDPCYAYIENGEWLNDEDYAVIHRIAVFVPERGHGYAGMFFRLAGEIAREGGCRNLRADTHELNLSMQKALRKEGFVPCGIVYMQDGSPRIGFQKLLQESD